MLERHPDACWPLLDPSIDSQCSFRIVSLGTEYFYKA